MKLLLFLTISFCFVAGTLSCKCFVPSWISRLKLSYCYADFVIKAKVTSNKIVTSTSSSFKVYYKIDTIKHFKNYVSNFGIMIKPNFARVYTRSQSAACGVTLQNGKTYLLMGRYVNGRFRITSCSVNMLWNLVKKCDKRWMRKRPSCSWGGCPSNPSGPGPNQPGGPILLDSVQAGPTGQS